MTVATLSPLFEILEIGVGKLQKRMEASEEPIPHGQIYVQPLRDAGVFGVEYAQVQGIDVVSASPFARLMDGKRTIDRTVQDMISSFEKVQKTNYTAYKNPDTGIEYMAVNGAVCRIL